MVNNFKASVLTVVVLFGGPTVCAQTSAPPTDKLSAAVLIKLNVDDEKRALTSISKLSKLRRPTAGMWQAHPQKLRSQW
jgi:hypothetical protein